MHDIIEMLLNYINTNNAPGGAVFRSIKSVFPKICEEIDITQTGSCWTEKLYRFTHPGCIDSCKTCNQKLRYRDWQFGYRTYCSQKCRSKDPDWYKSVKSIYLKRFGVDHPFKDEKVKLKRLETWQTNHGTDNPAKSVIVQDKMRSTSLERYGVENVGMRDSPIRSQIDSTRNITLQTKYGVTSTFSIPEVLNKRKETWIEKYGESHPHKCKNVRDKYTATIQEKWGVDHPMQDAGILDKCVKSARKSKLYVLPSGREIIVQGYEPQALDILLAEGILEGQILNLRVAMPKLWYLNDKNKKSRYYPDFYIPHLNLIVEVKSEYTAKLRPDLIEKKKQAVLDAGYNYRIMILRSTRAQPRPPQD